VSIDLGTFSPFHGVWPKCRWQLAGTLFLHHQKQPPSGKEPNFDPISGKYRCCYVGRGKGIGSVSRDQSTTTSMPTQHVASVVLRYGSLWAMAIKGHSIWNIGLLSQGLVQAWGVLCNSWEKQACQSAMHTPIMMLGTIPYLQQWVYAIEVGFTPQWCQFLWWYIFHHPITQEFHYPWEVLRVPAKSIERSCASSKHIHNPQQNHQMGLRWCLSKKIEPSACVSMRNLPLKRESSIEFG